MNNKTTNSNLKCYKIPEVFPSTQIRLKIISERSLIFHFPVERSQNVCQNSLITSDGFITSAYYLYSVNFGKYDDLVTSSHYF